MFKKKLKRKTFLNLVDGNKIWNKSLSSKETLVLLDNLKERLNYFKFKKDNNFIMNDRRCLLKEMITDRFNTSKNYEENIKESLFNLWEFASDEYNGSLFTASEKLDISVQKLEEMCKKYKDKNIICLQEKEIILEIINEITSYIENKK